jgi:DNA-binding phage protein
MGLEWLNYGCVGDYATLRHYLQMHQKPPTCVLSWPSVILLSVLIRENFRMLGLLEAGMKTMTEQFSRWDSADYLKTEEERAEYLEVCMDAMRGDLDFIAKVLETIERVRGRDRFLNDTSGVPERGLVRL